MVARSELDGLLGVKNSPDIVSQLRRNGWSIETCRCRLHGQSAKYGALGVKYRLSYEDYALLSMQQGETMAGRVQWLRREPLRPCWAAFR